MPCSNLTSATGLPQRCARPSLSRIVDESQVEGEAHVILASCSMTREIFLE